MRCPDDAHVLTAKFFLLTSLCVANLQQSSFYCSQCNFMPIRIAQPFSSNDEIWRRSVLVIFSAFHSLVTSTSAFLPFLE
mmetsp:Transcript_2036/g.7301  ORF Transcript_2036/g.7301 Transcript_2036/m.7301 type:complete len:80 (-) Transcript_2036:2629-2868(-)